MRSIKKIWFMFAVVALSASAAFAASLTSSLDRDSITLGERAVLSVRFEGLQPQDAPDIPKIPGLRFQYIGPLIESSDINGQASSSITFKYVVTAEHDGEFSIPRVYAQIGGQQLVSPALRLTVNKPGAPAAADVNAGNELAFMKLLVPKTKVYVGEPILGQLDLYVRDDVQNAGGFQLTSSATDGFTAGNPTEQKGGRHSAQVGNHVYTVLPLTMPLTAVRTGSLKLGPFTANFVVVVATANQGGDSFIGRFFNSSEQKQMVLTTEPVSVESLPLPASNKPADFTGAIGNFTMSATAGPTTLVVGDPITVRVQISGHGAFDSVTLPPLDGWRDFNRYPPTTKLDTSDQFGLEGTKTFEQIISPKNTDVHELPALTFSFFNPDDNQYHTLTQPGVQLVVKSAGATPAPTIAASKNPTADSQAPPDVLPLKQNLGLLAQSQTLLVERPVFLATQSLPVLVFLAAFIWRKRADSLANNPRLRRQRAVAHLVASGLGDLKKHAAANQPDEFFATLFRLLQEQLGERLDCPASAITENVVDEHALLRSAPAALREALRDQFQLCNQARYAPVRGVSELNSVATQFEKLINQLQELKS